MDKFERHFHNTVLLWYELFRWPLIITNKHLLIPLLLYPPLSPEYLKTEITVIERYGSATLFQIG